MKYYTAAIFDFDGTLADSGEGIINCVLYALHKFGIPEEDRQKLTYFIGPPLFDSFRDLYGVSDADADRLVALYRERYHTKGVLESRLQHLKEQLDAACAPAEQCPLLSQEYKKAIAKGYRQVLHWDAPEAC